MRKLFSVLFAYLLLPVLPGFRQVVYSQQPESWTSSDMYLAIRKLNVLGSVLYVAAHPDDENTRLIAYFSKEKMYRTGYLSITRGDGGQNLIGNEQGVELGLIRTQELLAARRIDGGEQFFTRAFDFGFSKNPEETFTKWDKEKILSDVVWIIRKFQPDVIINRFPTSGEGGHGHHTASALLANEAFTAAADPSRFPEQLKYVKPWQAKRILWNSFNFGNTNLTTENQFKFDVGGYNPLLGKSYGEIAAASRSQHKSQGFGVPAARGETFEFFRTTGGEAPATDLFDGIETSWKRALGGEKISSLVDKILASFDLMHPEKSVKSLVELYRALSVIPDGYWKMQKLKEVQQIIEQCSGLWMDVFTQEQFAVQTDSIRFIFQFNNRSGVNSILKKINTDGFDTILNQSPARNKNVNFQKTLYVPAGMPVTQPYWLENKMEEGYFNVSNQQMIGTADVQPSYLASVAVNIEGEDFIFSRPVKYKFTDPVRGEIYGPLTIVPPYSLKVNPPVVIYDSGMSYQKVFTSYKNNNLIKAFTAPSDTINLKSGRTVKVAGILTDSFLLGKNQVKEINISTDIDLSRVYDSKGGPYTVAGLGAKGWILENHFNDQNAQKLYNLITIKHDHIPSITYFTEARNVVRSFDMKTEGKKIGYIAGAGDKVPEALEQMGYEVNMLSQKELSKNDLDKFDAIITGVRAYNTIEWIGTLYDKLMKYVERGGNLIVQYNTNNFISNVRSKIGPYHFTITRSRVTDENAPVTFLNPNHPVLNFPNKITQDDFKGWVQERSIYDAVDTVGNFEKIISMNDPGEKPDEGSLIIAKYGKGYFTYTGLVFFRQLPAGVPGAYRLLANLVALNRKKAF